MNKKKENRTKRSQVFASMVNSVRRAVRMSVLRVPSRLDVLIAGKSRESFSLVVRIRLASPGELGGKSNALVPGLAQAKHSSVTRRSSYKKVLALSLESGESTVSAPIRGALSAD